MSYRIVTIANKNPEFEQPYYTFTAFFKSLKGEEPLVLGSRPGEYGGLGSKPRLLYQAIMNNEIKESHIIFCDCFDLVFSRSPKCLYMAYLTFNTPFMISAEQNCFPADLKDEYDKLEGGTRYKYLNSGMIVAEVAAMLAVLESMDAKNIPNDYWDAEKNCRINPNDQEYYQREFLKQPVKMTLDRGQVLSRTLHDADISELKFLNCGLIQNVDTGSIPESFHFNGNGKTGNCRDVVLKHLGLL